MEKAELKELVAIHLPDAVLDDSGEFLSVSISAAQWAESALRLSKDVQMHLDYLMCVTAVDWKTHLTMVYHLSSTLSRHTLVVKAKIENRENPEIASVSHIWRTAEFHELEAYDLMGIRFIGHPGLRRLFLTDDFKGWPLRKDFEDPINMIEL